MQYRYIRSPYLHNINLVYLLWDILSYKIFRFYNFVNPSEYYHNQNKYLWRFQNQTLQQEYFTSIMQMPHFLSGSSELLAIAFNTYQIKKKTNQCWLQDLNQREL